MHYGPWGRVIGDIELLVSHQSSASVTTESTGYFVYMSFHSLLMGPKFCSAARLRPLMSSWLFYSFILCSLCWIHWRQIMMTPPLIQTQLFELEGGSSFFAANWVFPDGKMGRNKKRPCLYLLYKGIYCHVIITRPDSYHKPKRGCGYTPDKWLCNNFWGPIR
ncbi:hypothetical protein K435DRAFT_844195 [Dendrothele bispora CBS 962.96]|uniref:Uncharacterized protein n=1 Tax=Dendrothele bispora (strain CBS 962.96) TaxID=1314807 RepID=A0A4S8L411_DENBC|nr:hypothetical protein K435DRAFT_844195 [Dendrothele bispora CBS 962.96]